MQIIGGVVLVLVVWWLLQIIGNWKIFEKAGKPGWHSVIPFLNTYDEYDLCWSGGFGLVYLAALIAANSISQEAASESGMLMAIAGGAATVVMVLQVVESYKLARAFGKGIGYTIFLILLDRLARIVLGFSSAQYVGKDR